MSKPGGHEVIVIRRIKKHAGHHGGAWKVAYADFVTAMMAFFLVMWLVAQDASIRDAVAGYFQDPGALPHESSNSVLGGGPGGIEPSGRPVPQRTQSGLLEAEQKALASAAEHIQRGLETTPEFGSLRDQVEFTVTPEGLRIELIDRNQSSFFGSGSSVLRGETVRILAIIAQEVAKLPNDVVIEGHTDSAKYANGDRYGNWDLSADRANAARRVMQAQGLRTGQVWAVRGFADNERRIPDQPLDSRNRRVSIVVRSATAAALDSSVRARPAAAR